MPQKILSVQKTTLDFESHLRFSILAASLNKTRVTGKHEEVPEIVGKNILTFHLLRKSMQSHGARYT